MKWKMRRTQRDINLEHIHHAVEKLMLDGEVTLERVACSLGMRPRTLKRQLRGIGITFTQIVDACRKKTACILLTSSNARVYQIASALGYKDPSSFSRAFYRWSRMTPRQYRSQVRDNT